MTQPTTTPTSDLVPSRRPADFLFNVELLDILIASDQATVLDRKGVSRLTYSGAIQSLMGTNPRGAWSATPTPADYALKDLAVFGGVIYICTLPHTPSGSFATDLAAGKWAVHKGVTAEDLALAVAAEGIGIKGGGKLQHTLDGLVLSITDYPYRVARDGTGNQASAIEDAALDADAAGVWLRWPKGIYRITQALALTLTRLRWISEGAVILVDTSGDVLRGLDITLADDQHHELRGTGFEVNANGKCHGALRFRQPLGTQTASICLASVGARNVQMQVGAGTGSSGVDVRGGFRSVELIEPYAENIMMRTGAGVTGSNGVTGIIVQNNYGTAGAYPKRTVIKRPRIRRVYSQDASYQYDMDGIGLFANPSDSTHGPAHAVVENPDISGCWGRDIKSQVSVTQITTPTSLINEGPTGGLMNPAYDIQTGHGKVVGGQYSIDGVAHNAGIVAFQITADAPPTSPCWDGGEVDVRNGGTLARALTMDSIGTSKRRVCTARHVTVKGAVENFGLLRTNGYDIHIMRLESVVCDSITDTLVKVISGSGGSSPYRGIVQTRNCINLGTDVPTVRCNVSGNVADVLLDDVGGIGFGPAAVMYSGGGATRSALSINNSAKYPTPLSAGNNSGTEKLYSFQLAAGADITLPTHGFNGNYLAQIIIGVSRTGYAMLSVDGSGITSIDVGADASIGTTSDPGASNLRVWRLSGTNQLVVKNGSASLRVFLCRLFG